MKRKRGLLTPIFVAGAILAGCSGEQKHESARVIERSWEGRSVATQTIVETDYAPCHESDIDDESGFFGGRSQSCSIPDDAINIRLVDVNIGCAEVEYEIGEFQYRYPGDYECWDGEDSEGNTIEMGNLDLYEFQQVRTEEVASCVSTSADLRPNKSDFKLALIPEQRCNDLDEYNGRTDVTVTHYPYSYHVIFKIGDRTARYETTKYHYENIPTDEQLFLITSLGRIACYTPADQPEGCQN